MWLAIAAAATAQAPQGDPIHYTVRPGDTLSQLAHRYLATGHDWRDLKRIWRIPDPQHLPAGRTFAFPRSWLRWTPDEAQVVSVRGTVSVQTDGKQFLPNGAVLAEGAHVMTAANSFTTLALTNGSRITLPSQSDVTIVRLRKYAINNTIEYRFKLDRGTLDTKDTPLKNPDSRFIIDTPLAMTAVRGTEYAVSFYPPQRQTGTAVFEGTVAVSGSDGKHSQLVPERFGAVTAADGKSITLPLLPAPDLANLGRMQTDDLVTFEANPIAGATGYHAQLAGDAGFIDSFDEQESASPHFEFSDVPNGKQFVRISAIGPGNLRGMRQSYSFSRHLASIKAEAERTDDGFVFKWFGHGEGARHYRLQIFRDVAEGRPVVDEVGLSRSEATVRNLPRGVYFWRVGLAQTDAEGTVENWTAPEKLTIANQGD